MGSSNGHGEGTHARAGVSHAQAGSRGENGRAAHSSDKPGGVSEAEELGRLCQRIAAGELRVPGVDRESIENLRHHLLGERLESVFVRVNRYGAREYAMRWVKS